MVSGFPAWTAAGEDAAEILLTRHLRITGDAAAGLMAMARKAPGRSPSARFTATAPYGLELVAETRLHTQVMPQGWTGYASRWVLAWTPATGEYQLVRLEENVRPRTVPAPEETPDA
jgi:hypothetical protein